MKTVLFDLDGTLLPMEQEEFIRGYFGAIATKLAAHGYEPQSLIEGIWAGTAAMIKNDGSVTNEEVFWNRFCQLLGPERRKDEPIFANFYRNEFQFVALSCGFDKRAAEIIAYLKAQGCRIVLATNPIFPAVGTYSRIQWAGLEASDFDWITTYENSHYCKPNPAYYHEILNAIGESPENCIMVGNDVTEDMIAKDLGMEVFLLTDCLINKQELDIRDYPQGSFPALLNWLKKHI